MAKGKPVEGTKKNDEYLRRNLLVAKAYGAHAAVRIALARALTVKRMPKWLVEYLRSADERMPDLPPALARYRDAAAEPQP
jgi:hypothetical protein